ncbi:MAG: radical SAM family heme chaperone HemW [Muribaculaceae bacterium]|nr:radical SAM family heme chaperone HemW [Muribaculaceae bacterium]
MESKRTEDFGVYIHFPFCRRKCLYCDFYSVGDRLADWGGFASAVENEFKSYNIPEGAFVSLYMGGGTPSLAPSRLISRFREMIPNEIGEFTIEVNPDDVTEEKVMEWMKAGVNRVSMGVQSLNDVELKTIGRRHSASQAIEAYNMLRKEFSNISLDLIFGLPGQTLKTLSETLDSFVSMRPEHISAYSLMYEERTALTRLRDAGKLQELPEEDSVEMFRMINERLRDAGYERYEISNYALPGFRSHHNSNYWKGVPYLGLGPSAHSYDGGATRRYNVPDLSLYIKEYAGKTEFGSDNLNSENTENASNRKTVEGVVSVEYLSEEELREEMIMTRLRMSEGLSLSEYQSRFGEKEKAQLLKGAASFIKSGNLFYPDADHLAFTETGVMISDEIISRLF